MEDSYTVEELNTIYDHDELCEHINELDCDAGKYYRIFKLLYTNDRRKEIVDKGYQITEMQYHDTFQCKKDSKMYEITFDNDDNMIVGRCYDIPLPLFLLAVPIVCVVGVLLLPAMLYDTLTED